MTKESTGYKTEVQDSKVTKVFHNGEHIGTVAHSFFIHHPSGDTLSKSYENHYHAVDALKIHHDKYNKGRVDESYDRSPLVNVGGDFTSRLVSRDRTKVYRNGKAIGDVFHPHGQTPSIHHYASDDEFTTDKANTREKAVRELVKTHKKHLAGEVNESHDGWTTRYLSNNKIKIYNGGKLVEEIQWVESNSDKSATVNFNKERIGEINPKYRDNGSFANWEWSHDHSGASGLSASKTEARNELVSHHREHSKKYE